MEGIILNEQGGILSDGDLYDLNGKQSKNKEYDLNGSPLMEFSSYDEAELKTEIPKRIIQRAVSGEKKTGSGYMWRKVKEDEPWENINPLQNNNVARSMPVWQISLEGDLVGVKEIREDPKEERRI